MQVTSLDLSKDMTLLAVCSRDDQIQVIQCEHYTVLQCKARVTGYRYRCYSVNTTQWYSVKLGLQVTDTGATVCTVKLTI